MPPSSADMAMTSGGGSGGGAGGGGGSADDMSMPTGGTTNGPTVSGVTYGDAPVGGVVLISGSGFAAGDTVQMSGANFTTVSLTTVSLTATAIVALIPPVGTTPPASATLGVVRNGVVTGPVSFNLDAGKAWYVATTGADTNDGSYAHPFATLNFAATKMAPGDVTYVRGGTYTGYVTVSASGAAGKQLAFTAFPGEQPLLVGPNTTTSIHMDTLTITGAYVTIDHMRITDQNNPGQNIWIGDSAHNVTISNCEIFGAKGQGILVSGNSNFIYRNNVHDNGAHPPFDHGMYIESAYNVIRSNTVHDNETWGIHLFNGYTTVPTAYGYNIVEYNYVYGNGAGTTAAVPTSQAGGIIVANGQSNSTVRNNITCGNAQYGFYLIDQVQNTTITGNVSCWNKSGGYWVRYPGTGNTMSNNISYNDSVYAFASAYGMTSDNNDYYNASAPAQLEWGTTLYSLAAFQTASGGQDLHSTLASPSFKNPPTSGFSETSASSYNFCTTYNAALCSPLP